MRGRKPKPTALKMMAGNPGKRAVNSQEPKFRRSRPRCPAHLTAEAKNEWRRISGELFEAGLLTLADRAALAGYCQAYGRWVKAERALRKRGLVVRNAKGNLVQNPLVGIVNKAMDDMRRFAVEFGMTPSSRTRISVGELEEPDLIEQLFRSVKDGRK